MENPKKTLSQADNSALHETNVVKRWKFFYDGEEDGWTFEIEAKDYIDAFEKAYETHGPQVKGMLYTEIIENSV